MKTTLSITIKYTQKKELKDFYKNEKIILKPSRWALIIWEDRPSLNIECYEREMTW